MNNEQIAELIKLYSIDGVLRVWEFARAVEAEVLQHFSKSDAVGYQAYQNAKGLSND